jgi:hypothetical protein
VVAAAVRLPKRRHAEEAEPNLEGLGIRRRAPGPAVIVEEHRHRHGEAVTSLTPKGCLTNSKPGWRGAYKKDVREGIVVGRPTCGVRAEPVGRGESPRETEMLTHRLKAPVNTRCRTRQAIHRVVGPFGIVNVVCRPDDRVLAQQDFIEVLVRVCISTMKDAIQPSRQGIGSNFARNRQEASILM